MYESFHCVSAEEITSRILWNNNDLIQFKNTEVITVELIPSSTKYILNDLGKKTHSSCASAPNT